MRFFEASNFCPIAPRFFCRRTLLGSHEPTAWCLTATAYSTVPVVLVGLYGWLPSPPEPE